MGASSITNQNAKGCVAAQFDAAVHGTAVGDYGLRVRLPKGAVVCNVIANVLTAFTSANSTATIALKAETANDLFTAAAVSGAPFSSTGRKIGIPDYATVADYKVTTAEREITLSIAVEAITAGKADFYVEYYYNQTA